MSHKALAGFRFCSTISANIVATQAAAAVLASLRNPSTDRLLKVLSVGVRWTQTGAHTAAIRAELGLFRVHGFTAPYTTNIAAPGYASMESSSRVPQGAAQQVTAAGAAAGMTGATIAGGASSPIAVVPQFMLATVPTAGPVPALHDHNILGNDRYIILGQDDGLLLSNTTLLGAAAGSHIAVTFEWQEIRG